LSLIFTDANIVVVVVVVYFHRSYRITHPLDMESGYNNTECVNNYNIWDFSAI